MRRERRAACPGAGGDLSVTFLTIYRQPTKQAVQESKHICFLHLSNPTSLSFRIYSIYSIYSVYTIKSHQGVSLCSRVETHGLDTLQKGGVPAAPSGTATLLRLSPNHQFYPRPVIPVFRHPRLSWLDGRCVQGPGTYSPRHG